MNDRLDLDSAVQDDVLPGNGGMLGLLGAAHSLQQKLEAALESVGLSTPKYMTLQRLVEADDPISLSAQAECRKCERSNITKLIDRLESDGLAKRVDDPADRRAVLATATKLGRERFAAATAAINRVQEELASRIAEQDREPFLRVLQAMRTN
jgi:DNA-binding MarR family transcriptional regulator